jgi:hypothetical protein
MLHFILWLSETNMHYTFITATNVHGDLVLALPLPLSYDLHSQQGALLTGFFVTPNAAH